MPNRIFGIHTVLSKLDKSREDVKEVLLQNNFKKNRKLNLIFEIAQANNLAVNFLNKKELDDLANDANHQGVILLVNKKQKQFTEKDIEQIIKHIDGPPLILVLDQIQDPHNLGACLRTAAAAGVHAVIAPKDGAASITPTVQKVACGATEILPYVQVTNLVRTMKKLQELGIWFTGTSLKTDQNLFEMDFKGGTGIVIGGENSGMRRLVSENCDYLVKIPMPGDMESLNASVATGICLFEVVRQRLSESP